MNTTDGHGGEAHLAPVTDLFSRRTAGAAPTEPRAVGRRPSGDDAVTPAIEPPFVTSVPENPDVAAVDEGAVATEPESRRPRDIPGFVDGEPVGGWEFDRAPSRDAAGWWVPPGLAGDGRRRAGDDPARAGRAVSVTGDAAASPSPEESVTGNAWNRRARSDEGPSAASWAGPSDSTIGGGWGAVPSSVEPSGTAEADDTPSPSRRASISSETPRERRDARRQHGERTDDNIVALFGGERSAAEPSGAERSSARPSDTGRSGAERSTAKSLSDHRFAEPATSAQLPPLVRAVDLARPGDVVRDAEKSHKTPLPWTSSSPDSDARGAASPVPVRSAPTRAPRLRVIESAEEPEASLPTDDEMREIGERALLKKLRGKGLSISEARALLRGLDIPAAVIDELIDHVASLGYLNDAALAEQLVYQAISKKAQGRRAIAQALGARGIPRDVVEAALAELDDDDDERALEFARSKARSMASLERDVALRRLLGQLARRGFSGSGAMTAAKTALDEVTGVRFR